MHTLPETSEQKLMKRRIAVTQNSLYGKLEILFLSKPENNGLFSIQITLTH